VRRPAVLLVPAALVLGPASEAAAYGLGDPGRWVPDLAAGWALIGCGLVACARRGSTGPGVLLTLAGFAWLVGGFDDSLVALHRGPLVHLLLMYPAARPRTAFERSAVAAGYVSAVVPAAWSAEPVAIALALLLVAASAVIHLGTGGIDRQSHLMAFKATVAIGVTVAGGACARLAVPSAGADRPALLAYELALAAVALALLLDATRRSRRPAAVADLVVDLGETRARTLQAALAEALGDPALALAYPLEDGGYVDPEGRPFALPGDRSVTYVRRDGRVLAVLVHDPAVLQDAALEDALRSVAGLAAANARLQGEVRAHVEALEASRRRLLHAGDAERRRLERRLREGAERRLVALADVLAGVENAPEARRAEQQIARILAELGELAGGLHPRALAEEGLAGALRALAAGCPVPVDLTFDSGRQAEAVESAAYFVCAEALANVAKYAGATRAQVAVVERDGRLSVRIADDGVGGADPECGSGLRGLADRVEALGGSFRVESAPGAGTRLAAELPLGASRDRGVNRSS
jgi:signal transduction histidine kinase